MNPAFLFSAACAPKYAPLGPMEGVDLAVPLPAKTVSLPSAEVRMIDQGQGTPLVFVHGLSANMGFWEYQLPTFAESHRVIALDLPGYGGSERPDAPYTPPWYAGVLVELFDNLGLDHAIIVGHSMGGQIAMTFALQYPERVEALVLAAPAGLESFSTGAGHWLKDYWHEERALQANEQDLRVTFSTLVFNRVDEGVERLLQERVRMGLSPSFRGTSVAASRSIAGMIDHPVAHRLGDIPVPTLIVYGTDDRMIPNPIFTGGSTRRIGEIGERNITDASLVMLRGAGHTVQHDDPDGFNAAVTSFLGSLP